MTNKEKHIPVGYKPSPLGPIPEDWEVKRLGEVGSFSKGSGVPKDKIISEGHPCLTYGDLYTKYDFVIKNIKSFIDEETSKESKEINAGDICFAGSGETPEDIGKCATYLENCPAYAGGDIVILSPNGNINSLWLSYLLNSDIGGKQRYKFAQGFSIVHIYPDNLKQIQIPVPPLPEQHRIVSVLSLWDTAIAKQTALIEQLTLRKRGLMQQLLTGKKRLKGFGEAWKRYKLKELCSLIKGEQLNSDTLSERGLYPVINGGINPSGYYDKYNSMENTITISEGGNSCGYVNFIKTKFWSGGHCYMVKDLQNVDLYYLYYALKHIEPHIMNLRVGSGLPNVQLGPLQKLILIAPPIEEQTAIASVLVNADKEIEIQKQKLANLQSQKRGLMQQLLTGKKKN